MVTIGIKENGKTRLSDSTQKLIIRSANQSAAIGGIDITYRIIILTIWLTSLSLGIVLGDTGGLAILAVDATNTQLDVGFREIDGTWTIQGDGSQIVNKTLKEAEAIFHSFGCDGIKTIQVSDPNPNLALDVVFNGSIASAIQVLSAYGVKNLPAETADASSYGYWMYFPGREYSWDSNERMYLDAWTHASLTGDRKPSEIREEEKIEIEYIGNQETMVPCTVQNEVVPISEVEVVPISEVEVVPISEVEVVPISEVFWEK